MLKAATVALMSMCAGAPAIADGFASHCVDVSVPKGMVFARHGRWIELTGDQWQFLRGIYAMDPQTPPGLPFGDHAVLAQLEGDKGGMVFFVDGDKACTPMSAPRELLDLIGEVGMGTINHESGGL